MMPAKRAIVFTTAYHPYMSGAEFAIKEIAERRPEYDWHVVTALMNRVSPRVERIGVITIHRVGLGHTTLDKFLLPLTGTCAALALHHHGRVSFVWSMMASQASVAASFFKLIAGVPLVLTLQEGDEESYLYRYAGGSRVLYRILIRPWHQLVFRVADRVTVLSGYLKKRAEEMGVKVPIDIVPNGVDLDKFKFDVEIRPQDAPRSDLKKTILITTSRLVEKNALGDVVEALSYLPDNVHFWIFGSGSQDELKKQSVEYKVQDRVKFFGHVDQVEIVKYLAQADIFIRPSLSEGLGSSFLEAMAMKLPVIATPVGGIPDFLVDGKTGLFCNVSDPKSIAADVKRLMDDNELREGIRERAFAMIQERYTWDPIAEKMRSVFDTIAL